MRISTLKSWRFLILGLGLCCLLAAVPAAPAQDVDSVTPTPRDGSWLKLHEQFLARTKEGSIDLLFLGDSITQGWHNNDVWKRFYGARHAANFGIGGDRTQHVLWRIRNGEIDGIHPKVVVLMIGTNNVAQTLPRRLPPGSHSSSRNCVTGSRIRRYCCSASFPGARSRTSLEPSSPR